MADEDPIVMEGWLRKRGNRIKSMWGERYFVLRGPLLLYFVKQFDTEPKGRFLLTSDCTVSSIRVEKKKYYFDISWPAEDEHDEIDNSKIENTGSPKIGKKKTARSLSSRSNDSKPKPTSTKPTLSGMLSSTAADKSGYDKERQLVLFCENYPEAEKWVQAIENQIRELSDSILGIPFASFTTRAKPIISAPKKVPPPSEIRLDDVEDWIKSSKWKVFTIEDGIRVFEHCSPSPQENALPSNSENMSMYSLTSTLPSVPSSPPCFRISMGMNGSVMDVFNLVMNLPPSCRTGVIRSMRVVDNIDNHTDVIHIMFEPIYLKPTWIAPRDLCLMRYWKQNSDGSFVICLDSTTHVDCGVTSGYVRGHLHGAYIISPPKEDDYDEEQLECMLSFIAQCDPKGWIWESFGYQHAFLKEIMLHVVDMRDAIDSDRFVQVHFDPVAESHVDVASSVDVTPPATVFGSALGSIPPPALPAEMWSSVDSTTFRIRGRTYLHDKVKTSSSQSLFQLVCVDVLEVPEPTYHVASHPRNRVALAKARGEQFWCFLVNIMVPGTPDLCFVMYFLGDKTLIDQDTPFGRIAKPFFYGNDDEFRNNRFKLIPKVVDGNMIVKMAVKDTPTLLGNKLKQYYFRDDNYFELDVDVGSSSVARNVVGLAIGYSKSIIVDMGLCLQGNEEDELPEVLMGGVSCIHVDMSLAKKL